MKVLNLYSGLGGNRKLWGNLDIHVTAVENNPRVAKIYSQLFPNDKVIQGDAHDFLLKNHNKYDFIWSSPPCQSHSRNALTYERYPDLKLYEEIIFLESNHSSYVVENVIPYYECLIHPTRKVGRHIFWSSVPFETDALPGIPNFYKLGTLKDAEYLKEYFGINYEGSLYLKTHNPCQALKNCVHPVIGNSIFQQVALGFDHSMDQLTFDYERCT